MQAFLGQLSSGRSFQQIGDLLDGQSVAGENQVYVFRENGTGPDRQAGPFRIAPEASPDGPGL
jgi:hypothetical protein